MSRDYTLSARGTLLVLRGDGTLYLPAGQALLVADLHLGKDASFRACGLPVPDGLNQSTLAALTSAIDETNATKIYLLGDLIHNRDSMKGDLREHFAQWRERHRDREVVLIQGNHDRHIAVFPLTWKMQVVTELQLGNFLFRHEVTEDDADESRFQIGGHWHPIVTIGQGADTMRLRSFILDRNHLTLPAFGPFKGGLKHDRKPGRTFFPICEGKIWKW